MSDVIYSHVTLLSSSHRARFFLYVVFRGATLRVNFALPVDNTFPSMWIMLLFTSILASLISIMLSISVHLFFFQTTTKST